MNNRQTGEAVLRGALAVVFAALLGFGSYLMQAHHILMGSVIFAVGFVTTVGWIITFTQLSWLLRFWAGTLVAVFSGYILLQSLYDEDRYQLSLTSGDLIPASSKEPKPKCNFFGSSSDQTDWIEVIIGSDVLTLSKFPQPVILMDGKPVLIINRTNNGIIVFLFIYDSDGNEVLDLVKNHLKINSNAVLDFNRPDFSTIMVRDMKGRQVVSLRLDNYRQMTISGLIIYNSDPVVVSGGLITRGASFAVHNCRLNSPLAYSTPRPRPTNPLAAPPPIPTAPASPAGKSPTP